MNKQNDTQKTQRNTADDATGGAIGGAVTETAPKYEPAEKKLPFEEGKRYTYSDYRTWGEDLDNGPDYRETKPRFELIDGIPTVMDAPTRRHQEIVVELTVQLGSFLKGKPCKVYVSPFDVRLNPDGADDTVLQPDILVVCDHSKLTDAGCDGAPDMVIEISSPSTSQRDRLVKLQQYEKYGVREYWIVEQTSNAVTVYILENGKYFIKAYTDAATIPVHILEGCTIDMSEVFS